MRERKALYLCFSTCSGIFLFFKVFQNKEFIIFSWFLNKGPYVVILY